MTSDVIIKRLTEEFPEFCWDEDLTGVYCGANFCIDYDVYDRECLSIPYTILDQLKKSAVQYNYTKLIVILAMISSCGEVDIPCEDIDERMFDAIISGVKNWKADIDKLRHGEDKIQLMLIHPDVDNYSARDILAHTRILAEDRDGGRIGLINAKDYDFGNSDFRDAILDNSRDCFAIWEFDGDFNIDFCDLYNKAKQVYPDLDSITSIFDTDYD